MTAIYWLAVGAFAVGTEAFMISAILPEISSDLHVSLQSVGQLVAIFSFAYAVSSPLLTALTAGLNRRKLLIGAMAAFCAANTYAATARGYDTLVVARVLLALAAGLYVPSANALAGALVPPARRGQALAIVTGGISAAVALGVPLGAFVGGHFGWRATFWTVAFLSLAAIPGLVIGFPKDMGSGPAIAPMRDRLAVLQLRGVFPGLSTTTLWATGAYTLYTFLSPYLRQTIGMTGTSAGYVFLLYGVSAFVGLLFGGVASDRVGSTRLITAALLVMAIALASLSAWPTFLPPGDALVPILISVAVWGFFAWGFFPAQQSHLLDITGMHAAPVILSLNASFMYLGFSFGAIAGSATLTLGDVGELGCIAAAFVFASLCLHLLTTYARRQANAAQHQ